MHSEVFTLCYYSHGGFTHSEVYNMPIYLRRFYLKSIESAVDKENKEVEKMRSGSSSSIQAPPKMSQKSKTK